MGLFAKGPALVTKVTSQFHSIVSKLETAIGHIHEEYDLIESAIATHRSRQFFLEESANEANAVLENIKKLLGKQ